MCKLNKNGLVAQLGERSVRIREVEGSNPFESTTKSREINDFTAFLQLLKEITRLANQPFPHCFSKWPRSVRKPSIGAKFSSETGCLLVCNAPNPITAPGSHPILIPPNGSHPYYKN